jgi:membrane protein implicated in regulation of membrane protease activity
MHGGRRWLGRIANVIARADNRAVEVTTMFWWQWVIFGLMLAGLEVATGGFFLIFFGAGGLLVGALTLADVGGPLWVQWLLFSVTSIVALALFRNPLLRRMQATTHASKHVDALTAETATTIEDIAPGSMGRVELRGTAWAAKNVGPTMLIKGQRCAVQRVDGLTLYVQPEGAR